MVTMKDVMMASSIGEELVAYGREEGLEEGREEGQLIVARAHAISLADSRFPGLLNHSRVLAMNDLEALQRIFRAFLTATDREQVRAAVGPFLNS